MCISSIIKSLLSLSTKGITAVHLEDLHSRVYLKKSDENVLYEPNRRYEPVPQTSKTILDNIPLEKVAIYFPYTAKVREVSFLEGRFSKCLAQYCSMNRSSEMPPPPSTQMSKREISQPTPGWFKVKGTEEKNYLFFSLFFFFFGEQSKQ